MSIWCSHPLIGTDPYWERDHDDPPGDVRSYAEGWSNHYPDNDVEQPAAIDTAHIAPWCVPGWWDREDELDGKVGPWLRLAVMTWKHDRKTCVATDESIDASVVLDEDAVRSLVADLTDWLGTPKVHPS